VGGVTLTPVTATALSSAGVFDPWEMTTGLVAVVCEVSDLDRSTALYQAGSD